jgi:nucleotide-binding universal stress UspA family protein
MYCKILVPIDGSSTSEAGVAEAVRLARMTGGAVRLLHVAEEAPRVAEAIALGGVGPDVIGPARERGLALLHRAEAVVQRAAVACEAVLLEGTPGQLANLVCAHASNWSADVIVLGTHGRRGVGRMLLGSEAEQIARRATMPVLLVHRPEADVDGDVKTQRVATA